MSPRKKITKYAAMMEAAYSAAEKHPRSMIALDARTHKVLRTGRDSKKVLREVMKNLKPGQVPLFYRKPDENSIHVFETL